MIDNVDNIEKIEEKEYKNLNKTKNDDSFFDTLSDVSETVIEIISNIIKD